MLELSKIRMITILNDCEEIKNFMYSAFFAQLFHFFLPTFFFHKEKTQKLTKKRQLDLDFHKMWTSQFWLSSSCVKNVYDNIKMSLTYHYQSIVPLSINYSLNIFKM